MAAEEFAQRTINLLKSLRLRENGALDAMELLDYDRTWLETMQDNVSCFCLERSVILFEVEWAYFHGRHFKSKIASMQHLSQS